jgi:hypothetical protein
MASPTTALRPKKHTTPPASGEMIRDFGSKARDADAKKIVRISDGYDALLRAHDTLAVSAKLVLSKVDLESVDWGTKIKRLPVICQDANPLLVTGSKHNVSEVMNMCATVERLLDALKWARDSNEFTNYEIEICHPTTGATPEQDCNGRPDNDLILIDEKNGMRARFEVTDSAKGKDTMKKEKKDLTSLHVLRKFPKNVTGNCLDIKAWPKGRLFLVVSNELARNLVKTPGPKTKTARPWRSGKPPHCEYADPPIMLGKYTTILEVLDGRSIFRAAE